VHSIPKFGVTSDRDSSDRGRQQDSPVFVGVLKSPMCYKCRVTTVTGGRRKDATVSKASK